MKDEQKEQIAIWDKQAIEQRKQILQQQVQWGWISQAEADKQIVWMQQGVVSGASAFSGHHMGGHNMEVGIMHMGSR